MEQQQRYLSMPLSGTYDVYYYYNYTLRNIGYDDIHATIRRIVILLFVVIDRRIFKRK